MLPAAPVTATRTGDFMDEGSGKVGSNFELRSASTTAGLLQFGEEFLEPAQAFRQLRGRAGVGDAQRARLAKGRAGHAGHALGFQEGIAQVDVVADLGVAVAAAEGAADV